jgi:hypothetical protein
MGNPKSSSSSKKRSTEEVVLLAIRRQDERIRLLRRPFRLCRMLSIIISCDNMFLARHPYVVFYRSPPLNMHVF